MGMREMKAQSMARRAQREAEEATRYRFEGVSEAGEELRALAGKNFLDDGEMMRVEGFGAKSLDEVALTSLSGWLKGIEKAAAKWSEMMGDSEVAKKAIEEVLKGVKRAQALASKGEARNVREEMANYTRGSSK